MSCIRQTSMVFVLFTVTTLVLASAADELSEPNEAEQPKAAAAADGEQEVNNDWDVPVEGVHDESELRERGDRDRRRLPRRPQNRVEVLERQVDRWRRQRESGNRSEFVGRLIDRVEEELAALRRQEHRDQVEGHRREGHGSRRRSTVEEHRPHPEIAERIEHMQAAVRHLVEAGLPHIAEQVERQIIDARRELESRRHWIHHESDMPDVLHQVMRQLDELRHEVGELRETVETLREDD